MERKIFQHLLELKSLQIRSNKLNESVLVKRAVDDYHKSCVLLGGETGTRLRRYTFTEYTFKNFELFLYETLKGLQKPGNNNFQNINEVYEEVSAKKRSILIWVTQLQLLSLSLSVCRPSVASVPTTMRMRKRCSAPPRRIAACTRRTPTRAYPVPPTVSSVQAKGEREREWGRERECCYTFARVKRMLWPTRFEKGQGAKCADSIKINPNYEQFIHLAEQPSGPLNTYIIPPSPL